MELKHPQATVKLRQGHGKLLEFLWKTQHQSHKSMVVVVFSFSLLFLVSSTTLG